VLNYINSLRNTLVNMRNNDSEYKKIFDSSVILCMKHDINIPESNTRKMYTNFTGLLSLIGNNFI